MYKRNLDIYLILQRISEIERFKKIRIKAAQPEMNSQNFEKIKDALTFLKNKQLQGNLCKKDQKLLSLIDKK